MTIELILPALEYESSYGAYIRELGDEERYPFPLDFEYAHFPALLGRLADFASGANLPGLGIRPSHRGRGLGNELLARTIQEARKKNIAEIHIHCHKSNLASARMIGRNGGVLVSESQDEGSHEIIQRHVIVA